ncbi:SpoIIE family protein phosphatase [bacterium]|nr:SpoIIE family protein phosphatase [bacterium]
MITSLETRSPRILLCSTDVDRVGDIQTMLDFANYEISAGPLSVELIDPADPVDLVLMEGPACAEEDLLEFCRQVRERLADRFVPLIFVTDDASPIVRAFSSRAGTDGFLVRPLDPVVLLSQVQALLRIKFLQDRVVAQSREIEQSHEKIRIAYQMIDQELQLARRIQQSMLPRELPSDGRIQFGVRSAVSGQVSGDIYDAFRLQPQKSAFYVADAMGHGVPAGLLTIFAKKGIQPVEIIEGASHIISPGKVLETFNRDLVRQDLSENPFITMAYFTLDHETLALDYARGGHPYPLRVPTKGPIEEWKAEGTLLGVFDTEYPTESFQLAPGDKLLIYTDGIDSVTFGKEKQGLESFRACVQEHRGRPIQEMIDRIYDDLFPTREHDDDFTLLGFSVAEL